MSINIPTAYKVKVPLNYGELRPIIEWCERNLIDEWRYMEDPNDQWASWIFFFESERDYCAFLLWNKL